MSTNFFKLQKTKKMNSPKNIFGNAVSIKSLVEKVKTTNSGIITFMTTGSCIDTGPTLFVSNQNFPSAAIASNK
jgi:hypothetical protein